MTQERLEYKGKLFEKEGAARSLSLRCTSKVDALRRRLDPTEHPENLDIDAIREQAFELVRDLGQLRELNAEIARIEDVLGHGE